MTDEQAIALWNAMQHCEYSKDAIEIAKEFLEELRRSGDEHVQD